MDTGYYKFYYDKRFFILPIVIFFIPGIMFFASSIQFPSLEMILLSIFYWVIYFICCLKIFIPFFKNKKPYIEITPDFIQIGNYGKLFWKDIKRIEKPQGKSRIVCEFCLKDISKYSLTKVPRLNSIMGWSPFIICVGSLRSDDVKKLIKVLKGYIPNNNLN